MTSTTKATSKASGICPELISELAHILDQTNLTELEVEKGDLRIKVSRSKAEAAILPANFGMYPLPMPVSQPMPNFAAAPQANNIEPVQPVQNEVAPKEELDLSKAVTSPMVGTIYLAPAPDEPPFVKVGDHVNKDQPLLIVEAKKTMNYIGAPKAGIIRAILVENTQPVEFGEPLVIIE